MADIYRGDKRVFRGAQGGISTWLAHGAGAGPHEFKEMGRRAAIAAIRSGVRDGAHTGWFRRADGQYKGEIIAAIRSNPEVKDAAINLFHQEWNTANGTDVDFATFLDTPVTLYRGGPKPKVGGSVFVSYSTNRETAEKFASQYGQEGVHTIQVRPRDTYGMMQTIVEGEVMVPPALALKKAMPRLGLRKGLFIGKRGGKWADPQHTIPYKEAKPRRKAGHVSLSRDRLEHLLQHGTYSLISGGRNPAHADEAALPEDHQKFADRHEALKRDVEAAGYDYTEVEGHYGGKEKTLVVHHAHAPKRLMADSAMSLMVHHAHAPSHYATLRSLGARHNQDSVVHSHRGTHELHYTVGDKAGQHHKGTGHAFLPHADDFFTRVPHGKAGASKFSLNFDWAKTHSKASALLKSVVGPPPSPNRAEFPFQASLSHQGILIYVENMPGTTRSGTGTDGRRWSVKMRVPYGEIPNTIGADGDPIDVFVGPDPMAPTVFVFHQKHFQSTEEQVEGTYDEDKVMLGFKSEAEALRCYRSHFTMPVLAPGITTMSILDFREKVHTLETSLGAALTKGWLAKATSPGGGGWMAIPGGRHKGYRRRKAGSGGSGWEYWYPSAGAALKARRHHEAQAAKARAKATALSNPQQLTLPGIKLQDVENKISAHHDNAAEHLETHAATTAYLHDHDNVKRTQAGFSIKDAAKDKAEHDSATMAVYELPEDYGDGWEVVHKGDSPEVDHWTNGDEIVIPGEHLKSDIIEETYVPDTEDQGDIRRPDEDDERYDSDAIMEYELDREEYFDEDAFADAVEEAFDEAHAAWAAEREGLEDDDDWDEDAWDADNPEPDHGDFESEVDRDDYYAEEHMRSEAESLAQARYDEDLSYFMSEVQAKIGARDLYPGADLPVAQLTAAVAALNKESRIRSIPSRGETFTRTQAEFAVLNALSLFTAHQVDVCRNPDAYDEDEVGATDYTIGDWNTNYPSYAEYADAHAVLKKLAFAPLPPTPVFRGLRLSNDVIADLTPPPVGEVFELRDVASFSTSRGKAIGFSAGSVVLEMVSTRGTVIHDVSGYPDEQEVIVGGQVRVLEATKESGITYLKVEVVDMAKAQSGKVSTAAQREIDSQFDKPIGPRGEKARRPPPRAAKKRSIKELREELGNLKAGRRTTKTEKSMPPPDLLKSEMTRPTGGGWHAVPSGKHGGMRKKKATGKGYEYWYPGQTHAHAHKWERDLTRTHMDVKAGDVVEVGGRPGLWRVTPEHGKADAHTMWVTSESNGSHERVRSATVYPQKKAEKRAKRPPKKSGKGAAGARRKQWAGPISSKVRKLPPKPEEGGETAGEAQKWARPFAGTEHEAGSPLHKLESGEYMLHQIKTQRQGERLRWAIWVPPHERDAIVNEMAPHVRSVVRKVLSGINRGKTWKEGSEQYRQVEAGALTGLAHALTRYQGGKPFVALARSFMQTGAMVEARSEMGAARIPDRVLRNVRSMVAATHQARSAEGGDPTPKQIASKWRLKKRDVYSGDLGAYKTDDGVVDQGGEEVPPGPWKVKTPAGLEVGESRAGKLALIDEYKAIVDTGKASAEVLGSIDMDLLPGQAAAAMPLGTAFHLRLEVESILKKMTPEHRNVLLLTFGMHADHPGIEMTAPQLGEAIGLKGSAPTVRRAARSLRDSALAHFKRLADREDAEVARHVGKWVAPDTAKVDDDDPTHGPSPFRASHATLKAKFGSDLAVKVYQAAMRAGHPTRTGAILEKVKDGTATARERQELQRDYQSQLDKERLSAFNRHRSRKIDPDVRVRDQGPQGLTSVENDYLTTRMKNA
jgi:hypothetical protein